VVRGVAAVLSVVLCACGRVGFDPLDGASGSASDGVLPDTGPGDCPVVGNICADGTVFVGMTPDGNVPMFAEPNTNYGGPWSFGTGSPPTTEVLTNSTSRVTGEAYTAALSIGGMYQDADAGMAGVQPHEAANYCTDLTFGGRTDWYLPAIDELRVMFNNAAAIGGWGNDEYWSSTEDNLCPVSCALLIVYPAATDVRFRNKYDYRNARCVRK
jgi:hypothetical protein